MNRVAASYVFTSSGAPLRNAYVEYADDGTVVSLGECTDIANEAVFHENGALAPGFVNAHCHVEFSYLYGKFRRGTGMAGFIDQINAMRDNQPLGKRIEDIRTRMSQMWDQGVSAMADISNGSDSFQVKASSPMYTRTFLEVFGTEPEDCASVMEEATALCRKAREYGLDAAPTPHACYTMSPELLTASSAAALEAGYLSYHSEETPEEEEMIKNGSGKMWDNRKAFGMSVPPVCGKSSLLYFIDRLLEARPAPLDGNILLVHEVCMDQEGIDAVKAVMNHPYIALCPLSNIFIHESLPPVYLMRGSGIPLTVGTDSLSSNDDLCMVNEIFCLQENFPDIPLWEILQWATKNGALFLGKADTLGSFEAGKRPGIVLIDHLSREGKLTSASVSRRII